MKKNETTVRNIFFITVVIAILFPLINVYVIYPSFTRLIVQNIEIEAERTAVHLMHELLPSDSKINRDYKTDDFLANLAELQEDFKFIKLRIFSERGEILYSTDPREVGTLNNKDYFHNTVALGNKYTKSIQKDSMSAEGVAATIDVVETYVPIMGDGVFEGAFEIYYDITASNQSLMDTLFRSSIIVLILMFASIMAMVVYLLRTDRENNETEENALSRLYFSPYYSLLFLAAIIFVGEASVMFLLDEFIHISPLAEMLFDSSLLVILLSPTLYFLLIRPLIVQIRMRRDAENTLLSEKERLHMTLQSIGDGVISTDIEGKILLVNRVAETLTGWTLKEAAGRPLADILSLINGNTKKPLETPCKRVLEEGKHIKLPKGTAIVSKDGSEYFISATAAPIYDGGKKLLGFIFVFRDLTRHLEAKREKDCLERQLLQAQKLEAVGTLAAGIAHEINTPIQFIGDNTHFLKDSFADIMEVIEKSAALRQAVVEGRSTGKLAEEAAEAEEQADIEYLSEEIPKSITQVLDGVDRVSTIVKAMKAFSHPDTKEMTPSDLNRAIQDTLIISNNEYKYIADIETEFDDNLPPVPCYFNELSQVFLNLIVNAAHAISDANGNGSGERGLITITTRKEKDEAVIEFSDSGTGIPGEVAPHIFEQFFTTKEVGKGTGQGLSIAHAVVTRKHHGTISFETEVGRGTTFIIRLPLGVQQAMSA